MKKFDKSFAKTYEHFKDDFMRANSGEYYFRIKTNNGVPCPDGFEIDPIPWEESDDLIYNPELTREDIKKAYCESSPEIIRERYQKYLEWFEKGEDEHPDYEKWLR